MKRLLSIFLLSSAALTMAAEASRYPYQSCFEVASRLHNVPVDLLLGVAATESNWDPDARSHANAHGIMQIQWPGTAKHLGVRRPAELYNPCLNIELGARYLRELLDQFNNDTRRALAAYNYGPTRIAREKTLPPGAVRYVEKVLAHRAKVNRGKASWLTPATDYELIRFRSRTRAQRYAKVLDRQIDNADFSSLRRDDGSYAVVMEVAPAGLSARDTFALESLVGMEVRQ